MISIGIDLGGTNMSAGIVDSGVILHKKTIQTNVIGGPEKIMADMAWLCEELAKEYGINLEHILSVGIGSPGTVDPKQGIVQKAANLGFINTSISQPMSRLLSHPLPIYLENDANCAALGEHIYGAAKGSATSITITLGTGIGGGIIIDGKVYSGPFSGAGELGHHVIKMGGEACTCGRLGCWEAYASALALKRDGQRVAEKLNIPDKISARTIFISAKGGNPAAQQLVDNYLEYLCEGLGNIVNIFQPEIVVIGGGISGEGQGLLDEINRRLKGKIFDDQGQTKFNLARLGNDAGIIGAAILGGLK
jgi:glucokinase